jgi:hypothetical protein
VALLASLLIFAILHPERIVGHPDMIRWVRIRSEWRVIRPKFPRRLDAIIPGHRPSNSNAA